MTLIRRRLIPSAHDDNRKTPCANYLQRIDYNIIVSIL